MTRTAAAPEKGFGRRKNAPENAARQISGRPWDGRQIHKWKSVVAPESSGKPSRGYDDYETRAIRPSRPRYSDLPVPVVSAWTSTTMFPECLFSCITWCASAHPSKGKTFPMTGWIFFSMTSLFARFA